MNNYYFGHFAEDVALWYLRLKGYRKVAKNYVTGRGTGAGEVDLIVKKSKTLVFVEVKKRTSIENAAYAIEARQQKRIRQSAKAFLAANEKYRGYDIRFDAVLVTWPFSVCHLENAF